MSNLDYAITLRLIDKLTKPADRGMDRLARAAAKVEKGTAKTDRALKKQERSMEAAGRAGARAGDGLTRKQRQAQRQIDRTTKAVRKQNKALKDGQGLGVGGVIGGAAAIGVIKRVVTSSLDQMRLTERSKGDLQSLGMVDTSAVVDKGRQLMKQYAGIVTGEFVSAAYDIKSGISSLDDQGVADMTAAAAITAKATKGDVTQMTSLFATGYGTFKDTLYSGLSDADFGAKLSAGLAASVQAFKTTGGDMQAAIQAAGSGLSNVGISMESQFAALGMLQQKMEAGVAGTSLKALEKSIVKADKAIKGVSLVGKDGNMKDLPELLNALEAKFGKEYTSKVGAELQEAFGSEEAVKFFSALWGQGEALEANSKLLRDATDKGMAVAEGMAKDRDNNWDSRLILSGQKIQALGEAIGYKLIPVLDKIIPIVDTVVDGITDFVSGDSGIATIGVPLAAVVVSVGSAIIALRSLARTIQGLGRAAGMAGGGGYADGGRDRRRNTGGRRRFRGGGKIGKALGLFGSMLAFDAGAAMLDDPATPKKVKTPPQPKAVEKIDKAAKAPNAGKAVTKGTGGLVKGAFKRIPLLGLAFTGADILDTAQSDMTKDDKTREYFKSILGGIGGAVGGAVGATAGSVVPVAGTAAGGIAGGYAGYEAGAWLGDKAADVYLASGEIIDQASIVIGDAIDSAGKAMDAAATFAGKAVDSALDGIASSWNSFWGDDKPEPVRAVKKAPQPQKTEVKVPERKIEQSNNVTMNVTGYTDSQLITKVRQIVADEMRKSGQTLKGVDDNVLLDIDYTAVD